MDPAAAAASPPEEPLRRAISSHGTLLGQHQQVLQELRDSQHTLGAQITEMASMMQSLVLHRSPPPETVPVDLSSIRESFVPSPVPFDGVSGECRGFLLQCGFVFNQQPHTFSSDNARVAYTVGLLRGKALVWAEAWLSRRSADRVTYLFFIEEFKRVFNHPVYARDVVQRLLSLRQGATSAAEYAVDFQILATESGWGEEALKGIYRNSLSELLKDELAVREMPETLEELLTLSINMDNRIRERRRERTYWPPTTARQSTSVSSFPPTSPFQRYSSARRLSPAPGPPALEPEEPMQLGQAHLSPEERERRFRSGGCLYCGQLGHRMAVCPVRPKERARR